MRKPVLMLVAVGVLGAQPRVGGKIYFDYTYDLTDGTGGYNSFNITRTYFTVRGRHFFSEQEKGYAGYRITLDSRDINGQGYYEVFVKYAYVEIGGVVPGLKIRLGQVPTPWIGFEERIWGFRFLRPVFVDAARYMSSTDRGVGVLFKHRRVDLAVNMVNGEGYHRPEVSKHKDWMARLSLFPFAGSEGVLAGLGLHAYGQMGYRNADTVRNRYIVALSEKTPLFHFMGSYVMTEDGPVSNKTRGKGLSLHGSVDLGKLMDPEGNRSFGLFARLDQLDPDVDVANDGYTEIVGGLFVHPCLFEASSPNVILSLNVLQRNYEDPNVADAVFLRLNGEIRF